MLSNDKFKNMKELYIYGIIDSIDQVLLSAAFACPNLQFLECECRSDKRKEFPKNIIKVLFDNLPELKKICFEWIFEQNDANPTDNPIFVKSELEAIVGKCKNKFKVEIGEECDNLIKISREM